jgi:putative tryptophan/tyrosine transport system substrate-binding protein
VVTRRKFITLIGGVAAWPLASRAQQTDRMRRIGVLLPYPKGDAEIQARVQAFRQELARLGWSEGSDVQLDERWSTDNMDLVRAMPRISSR